GPARRGRSRRRAEVRIVGCNPYPLLGDGRCVNGVTAEGAIGGLSHFSPRLYTVGSIRPPPQLGLRGGGHLRSPSGLRRRPPVPLCPSLFLSLRTQYQGRL